MESPSQDRIAPLAYLPSAVLQGADDAALSLALSIRDPRAEREAWRRFRPMVYRIALYATGSRAAARDIATRALETFLERVAGRAGGDEGESPTAMVLSIAARAVRRRLRWSWLGRGRGLPEGIPSLTEARGDQEVQTAVGRFIAIAGRLSPLARTAFALRYLEKRRLEEVAAAVGEPLPATRRLLRRSWTRLAAQVGGDPVLAELIPTLLADGRLGDDADEPPR